MHLNTHITYSGKQIITWWEERAEKYPLLSEIALRCLHVPTSSIEVERSFSSYSNVTKNPQQSSMSNFTKRGRNLIKWNVTV